MQFLKIIVLFLCTGRNHGDNGRMEITLLKYPFLFSDFVKTIKSDKRSKILNQNEIVHNIELLIVLITRCCVRITLHT